MFCCSAFFVLSAFAQSGQVIIASASTSIRSAHFAVSMLHSVRVASAGRT
jgi:hypothetical protein